MNLSNHRLSRHNDVFGLQLTNFKRAASLASVSTRASSTSSLGDLDKARDPELPWPRQAEALVSQASKRPRYPLRKVLLMVAAALAAVLWQLHVRRRSRHSKAWGFDSMATVVVVAVSMLLRGVGLRADGSSDFETPQKLPTRQALICIHPHGTYLMGLGSHVIQHLRGGTSGLLKDINILAADAIFAVPLWREVCLSTNVRSASARVVDRLVSEGRTIAIVPGGIHEQLESNPRQEKLFFAPNLGFVRTAIKHGIPLVAMYQFGENQLFDVPQWSRPISAALREFTGAGFALGLGRYSIPGVPKPVKVETRFSKEVDVGPADANPSDELVERVFRTYCTELHRFFDEHKGALLAEVAARGLTLVWRGHEDIDLSAEALGVRSGVQIPFEVRQAEPLGDALSKPRASRRSHIEPQGVFSRL